MADSDGREIQRRSKVKSIEDKSPEELTTSEVMLKIGMHYLCNGCNGCDFLEVAEICDAVPLHCAYMKLHYYFENLEAEGSEKDADSN